MAPWPPRPRVVIPDRAHRVTQRGHRRQPVFFGEADCAAGRSLVAEACRGQQVSCLAGGLMPNHARPIMVPRNADGLRAALSEALGRYSRRISPEREAGQAMKLVKFPDGAASTRS